MIRTVCVTGGTGFVGRAVIPALLASDFHVHALVRHGSKGKLPVHAGLTAFEGDVCDLASIESAMRGCDALIHLAGVRRAETKRTGRTYEDVDLGSVVAALAAMKKVGVRRIVLLSAAHVGDSFYVRTKKKAEKALLDAGVDWTILRPSFILGKGQRWPIIFSPFLNFFALFPGHYGDVARRVRSVTREQLAAVIVQASGDDLSIGGILDVADIRNRTSGKHSPLR